MGLNPWINSGATCIMKSLIKNPSVPEPEYFVVGCMKVTKASRPFCLAVNFPPVGWITEYASVLTLPYPSMSMHEGGRMYWAG